MNTKQKKDKLTFLKRHKALLDKAFDCDYCAEAVELVTLARKELKYCKFTPDLSIYYALKNTYRGKKI